MATKKWTLESLKNKGLKILNGLPDDRVSNGRVFDSTNIVVVDKKKPIKNTGKRKGEQLGHIKLVLRAMDIAIVEEYVFHPTRKWRFDVAVPALKIAFEYEGVFSRGENWTGKSRHTTIKGYTGDIEKYNAATKLGWTVMRYHAGNYKNCYDDMEGLLKEKGIVKKFGEDAFL